MSDLRYEYRYVPFGEGPQVTHLWSVVGDEGGLHISITDTADENKTSFGRFYGGLECHYRKRPDYVRDETPPDHENCWLIHAPCWHDGTSLYASEVIIPYWQGEPGNNERMFKFIKREYARRFQDQTP